MLYVIAFCVPPAALLLARKPVQAVIGFVCYVLAWFGVVATLVPGIILYFFPILVLWFGAFWFVPVSKLGEPASRRPNVSITYSPCAASPSRCF
jgi:hypothetical protein